MVVDNAAGLLYLWINRNLSVPPEHKTVEISKGHDYIIAAMSNYDNLEIVP